MGAIKSRCPNSINPLSHALHTYPSLTHILAEPRRSSQDTMQRRDMPRPRSLFNRRDPPATSSVPSAVSSDASTSPNASADDVTGTFARVRSERETMMGDADALRRVQSGAARGRPAVGGAAGRSRMPRSISAHAKVKRSLSSFRGAKVKDSDEASERGGGGASVHRSASAHPSVRRAVPSFRQTKDTTTTTSSTTTTNSTDKKSSDEESTREILGRYARSAKHVIGRAVAVPVFVLLDVVGSVAGRR